MKSPAEQALQAENAELRLRLAQAQADLRQNAGLFYTVVEQAPMGVYVVDAQFRLQQVNARAMPAFAKVDARVGRDFAEVMSILWGPELGGQLSDIFRHTLKTGEPYVSPRFSEYRQDLQEDRCYEWETQRVTLADGQYGVVCYFNDITENIRAEQTLRNSQEKNRLATEATGVGIWEWNFKTNRIRWDAQIFRIYGIAPTEDGYVTYETWRQCLPPEDLARQEELLQETIRRGGHSHREFRIRRPGENEHRYIQAVETVRLNSQGEPEWLVGTNLDITERRHTEAVLREAKATAESANRSKDQFLAALSHELRTPLMPVLIAAETLREDARLPFEVREQLSMIERNIALEARLLDDLFDITAVSQGKLQLRMESFDAHSLIGLAIEIVQAEAVKKNIVIECDFAAHHSGLWADSSRFQQVIWNLLRNAVKFTPQAGRITIRTREAAGPGMDRRLRIEVTDSGIGIKPDSLEKIFRPFEQAGATGSHRFGGLGLGLAIARAIVDLHKGRIWAESSGTNCGSTFVVELPGATRPAETFASIPSILPLPLKGESAKTAGTKIGKLRRLLVVEDHAPTLQVIATLLRNTGYEIVTASTVAEGLAAAAAGTFDLVISDLGLPDGSGIQLMEQLRSLYGVPGIALTGYGMDEDLGRTREAGFVTHLVKPVSIAELRRVLEDLG